MLETIKTKKIVNFNDDVTKFLDEQNHPLRREIEELRLIILSSDHRLDENIKWNAPNYCYDGEDRITMKIYPPGQIQIVFHRGTKKLEQPKDKIIDDKSKLLLWKENDRAVASFRNMEDIEKYKHSVKDIVNEWVEAAG